jgi:DNA invertase Pin-like site-specific DNA recombinase
MTTIGYARVSSHGTKTRCVIRKIRDAKECHRIYKEKESGKDASKRPQFKICLDKEGFFTS